ncbi:swr complex subunit [Steccherinum ochraceum]|uniref:SWR1-complex protein 4 n=1 Tax=Steccherinum ochraceum TaxID=92696 RepID=A0A4R0RAV8_9APHY|nr:swr complex subunit [Steccherinum ochraceum]
MAGPSASDVRAALSLGEPSSSTPPHASATPLARKPSLRKPEGMPRELYQLIGPSAPTLIEQFAKPQLKQKPNLGSGGGAGQDGNAVAGSSKVKWEWRTFKNGARSDGLKLSHWVKADTDPNADYPFAKYNISTNSYVYSQDEYTRLLEDKEWTKEETDYLFELAREYDGRFYVIGDRYDFPNGSHRSLEDLKDRYYSVCRKLIRNRPWGGDEASKNQLLSSFQFDKDREVTRKQYVASLMNRTPEQIAEEESLYIELKRLEQRERRFKKDRDELLRTMLGIESGLADIPDEDGLSASASNNNLSISLSTSGLSIDTSNKKRKKGNGDVETPISATPSSSSVIQLSQPQKKQQSAKSAAYDAAQCIVRTDVPSNASSNKSAHTPVTLRSFKIPFIKSSNQQKVTQLLAELKISNQRLVMPTRDNLAKLEGLMEAANALIDTKKLVDKVEMDLNVARARLGMAVEGGEADAAPAGGSASASGAGGQAGVETQTPGAMDVDEDAEGEQEDPVDASGRGQSVVSTRSTRSRKQARRSMSISSVDTAATGAGNKKRKR